MNHHHLGPCRAARGFTLIELAIAVAVAGVLLGVAGPDLSRTLSSRALAAQASEFMSALRFARGEAMKRGQVVAVCASDAAAPEPTCQAGRAVDWRAGWIVFADPLRRGQPGPDGQVLRWQPALPRTGGVWGTRSVMEFTAAGISIDAASHYRFTPPGGERAGVKALLVCVSKQGRPRLAPGGVCE